MHACLKCLSQQSLSPDAWLSMGEIFSVSSTIIQLELFVALYQRHGTCWLLRGICGVELEQLDHGTLHQILEGWNIMITYSRCNNRDYWLRFLSWQGGIIKIQLYVYLCFGGQPSINQGCKFGRIKKFLNEV